MTPQPHPPAPPGFARRAVLVLASLAVVGCATSPPAEFRLNLEGRDGAQINNAQREAIRDCLAQLFGTPDEPRVPQGVALDLELLRKAAGPVGRDFSGRERGLFRKHCVACHGVSGDGAGPIAEMLNPYPRDFRRGLFKYTSTLGGAKPVRDNLKRTLLRGVPGTAMPSFMPLADDEIDALLEYVKYLSIRGETELYVVGLVVDEDEYPVDMDLAMEEGVLPAAQSWLVPELNRRQYVVAPPQRPATDTPELWAASVAKGRELFARKDAQCVKCHGPDGWGDGEQKELYDDWNKPKAGPTPEQTADRARLFTLPIQQIRPRNFHEGIFRGGGRPEDLYWRIYVGIKGTPMPAGGPAPGATGPLTPEEIWHVVDYVLSLSRDG